ncbi:unannotated protein [freshwater metagenome]|uniref:Unannotated protein n=1 Tax=freshwater metagenome TaxID=449393 RepID=A0A6J7CSQ0_9ZZZZ|nr:DUF4188 domain-containing protein [Actinomycetota bacterium]
MQRNKVQPGRYTAKIDGEFVVFIIGMRFNKLWKVHRWFPVFLAMPRMLKELLTHPEQGYLGGRLSIGGRTLTMVQHWRSFDQLEAFARNADATHFPAWRRFNSKIGSNGDVGVYHETYRIAPAAYECVYANMPVMGLAAAGEHVAIGRGAERARERIAS